MPSAVNHARCQKQATRGVQGTPSFMGNCPFPITINNLSGFFFSLIHLVLPAALDCCPPSRNVTSSVLLSMSGP